jgi:hypothetical protein
MKHFEGYADNNTPNERNRLSHIRYNVCERNSLYVTEDKAILWYNYLLSLPFILDSLFEEPNLPDFPSDDFVVKVRTDIPADRLMNVLALFRYPYVAPGCVFAFARMVAAEVDEAIAFTIAVGVISPGYDRDSPSSFIYAGMDTEHAFVHQRYFSFGDAQNMIGGLLTEEWETLYSGRQEIYNHTGRYVRGGMEDPLHTRLTAFAGPSTASAEAPLAEDLCLPWLALRVVNPGVADWARRNGSSIGTHRTSALTLSLAQLLDVATYIEDRLQ